MQINVQEAMNQIKAISNIIDLIKHPREITNNDFNIQRLGNPNLSDKEININLMNATSDIIKDRIGKLMKGHNLSKGFYENKGFSKSDILNLQASNIFKFDDGLLNNLDITSKLSGTLNEVSHKLGDLPKDLTRQASKLSEELKEGVNSFKTKLGKIAKAFTGIPYKLGSKTLKRIDCSGFVRKMYSTLGINIPDGTYFQSKVGKIISTGKHHNDIKEGDLIFFATGKNKNISHVGVYLGNGQFAHASSSKGTTISTLNQYWQDKIVQVNRCTDHNDLKEKVMSLDENKLLDIRSQIKGIKKVKTKSKQNVNRLVIKKTKKAIKTKITTSAKNNNRITKKLNVKRTIRENDRSKVKETNIMTR